MASPPESDLNAALGKLGPNPGAPTSSCSVRAIVTERSNSIQNSKSNQNCSCPGDSSLARHRDGDRAVFSGPVEPVPSETVGVVEEVE